MRAVWARSAALMPVLTPSRASTEIVYAVRSLSLLCGVISGISSRSSMSPGIGTQMTPLEWRIVNAISSGRRLGGGEDDVALVLAVLVVDDHDRLAGGDVLDGPLDGVEADALAGRSCRDRLVARRCRVVSATVRAARSHTKKPITTNTA